MLVLPNWETRNLRSRQPLYFDVTHVKEQIGPDNQRFKRVGARLFLIGSRLLFSFASSCHLKLKNRQRKLRLVYKIFNYTAVFWSRRRADVIERRLFSLFTIKL